MSIVWTKSARQDVNDIWDYLALRNPDAAELTESQILKAIEGLSEFPKRGRPGRAAGTRELVIKGSPYVAVYWVEETRVVILRVLHGAQDWPNL
ncbi:Toxin RelE2 [Acaryochloris thomasi RCC1774]|uniref:Toxin RelE2 n=1 Tax=Acaryochloris thomasi RCC1774 TaxID=1764569 RepID=A0A2W1K257_9CYAN|nr:type II toxin-antitoxin system RelE/ParE family toxin [Acaryochloris thomasi]PZD75484.1 Toxin RelE2 [Acaryochloris thomasi RCC1774]